ncbi:MAG: hypothetical protein QM528_07135 [Phycisphaerales bacterium]|nr:hypothetical protein [Phycisphaerales bacterium]
MSVGYNLTRDNIKLIDGGLKANSTCVFVGYYCLNTCYYSNGDGKKYQDAICKISYTTIPINIPINIIG